MKLPEGKNRLDLVREGLAGAGISKRGRLIVGLAKLKEDSRNERRVFRSMDGLIASIRSVGLIEPITVTAETDASGADSYRIITGHRRYRAAKAAGLEQVEILIRDPEDEKTRRQKSVISNVQREDVGPVELAEALQAMMDEDERIKTQDDLARVIGKDKTFVSGMLRILSLPTALQQKVGSTQQSIPYDAMIRIARLDDARHQGQLVEMLLNGASQREIRERIDTIKGKPKVKGNADSPVSNLKPKRVYHTKYHASVIIQSEVESINTEQCMNALQEAMGKASTGTVE